MVSRTFPGEAEWQKRQGSARDTLWVQPKRTPIVVSFATLIFVSVTILLFGAVLAAKSGTVSPIFEPPSMYLPRNPLPALPSNASCSPSEFVYVSCLTHLFGKEVDLTYELGSRMVVRAAFRCREYNAGELITAWGTPTGIVRHDLAISLYWGTRSALLYTGSLRPESRVEFIVYDLDPHQGLAWHGFTTSWSNRSKNV